MRPVPFSFALAGVLAACGGVSPDPARMAEQLPEARTVDAETATRNRQRTTEAARHLADGDYESARELAEAVLASEPRAARARAIRARALADEAKETDPPELVLWRRAEGELRRASEIAPDDGLVAILHARFLQDDGHWTAAAERIERSLDQHPDDLEARRLAAVLRYDLGDERAAIAHLERVLAAAPEDAAACWRLAHARLRIALAEPEQERREPFVAGAVEAFARYQQLAPVDADGYLGEARARLVGVRGEPDADTAAQVLALYEQAADVAPDSPEPAFGRGVVLDSAGDPGGAEQAYRAALAVEPGHLPSLLNLAANLVDQGRPDEARPFALRALESDPAPSERRAIEGFLAETAPTGS